MINDIIIDLLGDYETEYMEIYADNHNLDLDEVHLSDVEDEISEDLEDKGFTSKEINEILIQEMNENTFYKLGGYMISLYQSPETLEEFKKSLKEDVKIDIHEEDVIKFWNGYQMLK